MSVSIDAVYFKKRKNSTKVPDNFDKTFDCTIKERCDWNSPVFILQENEFPYNYIRWGSQYYFVQSIAYIHNNLLEVSCVTDVLATFRTDIFNTSAYILYDTTANTEITDSRLSTKTTTVRAENVGRDFDYLGKGFCVALNTVGQDSCCCYIVTVERALTLLNHATFWNAEYFPEVDDPTASGATVFETVQQAIQKLDRIITYACRQLITSNTAADCITSACLIPVPYSAFTESENNIYLGMFDTTVPGKRRVRRGLQDASSVTIPWQSSDWRRNAPFTAVYLYIPFIGNINLPSSELIGATTLTVNVSMDETAGDTIFTVSCDLVTAGSATKVVGQYSANLSSNFPIGSANVTGATVGTTITTGVTAAVTSAAGNFAIGAAAMVGMLNSATQLPSTVGSAGGGAVLALFGYAPRCMVVYHDTNVDPSSVSAVIGTPAMAVKRIGTLSGFVQCFNAHVETAAHADEMAVLDDYLNGGVFIE